LIHFYKSEYEVDAVDYNVGGGLHGTEEERYNQCSQ